MEIKPTRFQRQIMYEEDLFKREEDQDLYYYWYGDYTKNKKYIVKEIWEEVSDFPTSQN